MEIVDPRINPALVPEGSRAVVIAEHQDEYRNLPSVRTPNGYVITRWAPSDEDRARILAGEDIFVTLLSTGAINPLFVTIGPVDWKGGGITYVIAVDGPVITLSCGHEFEIHGVQMAVGVPFGCPNCAKESK